MPCPRCRRSPEQCLLIQEAENQANYGGQPEPNSNKFSGPIWPRNKWHAYNKRIIHIAKLEGCINTHLKDQLKEITLRKTQNNEFAS